MHREISLLAHSDVRLLMQVALEMRLSELKDLINASIQHGPAISLRGRLHRIDQKVIPPLCWEALMEFIEWGAGIIAHDANDQSCYLLADSSHVERMLRLIAKHLDSDSGQNEKQVTLNRPNRLPAIKPSRKHDDSQELG